MEVPGAVARIGPVWAAARQQPCVAARPAPASAAGEPPAAAVRSGPAPVVMGRLAAAARPDPALGAGARPDAAGSPGRTTAAGERSCAAGRPGPAPAAREPPGAAVRSAGPWRPAHRASARSATVLRFVRSAGPARPGDQTRAAAQQEPQRALFQRPEGPRWCSRDGIDRPPCLSFTASGVPHESASLAARRRAFASGPDGSCTGLSHLDRRTDPEQPKPQGENRSDAFH